MDTITNIQADATPVAPAVPPFNRPGVTDKFLADAGCHHYGNDDVQEHGCRAEGIAIPFRLLTGEPILDNGKPFARIRLYTPTGSQKYHQRTGSEAHIYIPPSFIDLPRHGTLVLTEGEFKALSLCEAGFSAIGLTGISGAMRNVNSEPRLHDELMQVLEFHRPARVLFLGDSDVVLNSDFAREASKLHPAIFNSKQLAFVTELRVAVCPLGGPKGADDARASMGTEFNAWFKALVESGFVVPSKATATEVFCALLRRESEQVRKAITTGDEHERQRNQVRLLQGAGRLQHETAAMFSLRPLLAELFNVNEGEVPRMIKDAGGGNAEITEDATPAKSDPEETAWPHPVGGAELLELIAENYKRFCVLPNHAADVLAVWVFLSYCYQKFEFAAVIAVWSPEPECGKGRVLDVTEKLAHRAFRTANTSAAVLYHSVAKGDLSVLIDEFDSVNDEQREAIGNILKSGFQSNGKAHRMAEVNGEQVVVEFTTYCPKMLATIGLDKLDKATRTRSIGIRMQRKKRGDKIAKFRRYDGSEIRRKCLRWVKDNLPALEAVKPMDLDECATDRQEDVWEPLVAIARVAGGDWEKRIREAATNLSGGANTAATEAVGHQLLSFMREYFVANGDKADTKTLIERMNNSGDFSGINRGRGVTPYFLAQHLKPYGIEPRNLKMDGKVVKGYDRDGFDEAFQTYLLPPTLDSTVSKRYSATEAVNIDPNPLFQSATETNGSVSENVVPINVYADGSGVADSKAENAPNAEMLI